MPPKKKAKGKAKKGKKGKKKEDGGELSVEELYKRTTQEVGTLKSQLSEQQQYVRRSRASEQVLRDRVLESRAELEEEKVCKREITNDMTRQYKTMQTQMEARIHFLETQVWKLQSKLEETELQLSRMTLERDQLQREKEEEVAALNGKLHTMERSYETILQDALDALAVKLESARAKWTNESDLIELRTYQVLTEFGKQPHSVPTNP